KTKFCNGKYVKRSSDGSTGLIIESYNLDIEKDVSNIIIKDDGDYHKNTSFLREHEAFTIYCTPKENTSESFEELIFPFNNFYNDVGCIIRILNSKVYHEKKTEEEYYSLLTEEYVYRPNDDEYFIRKT